MTTTTTTTTTTIQQVLQPVIDRAYARYDADPRVNGPEDKAAFREAVEAALNEWDMMFTANGSLAAPIDWVAVSREKFVAWHCDKCGRYHCKLFPEEGCDWCRGDKIAERMGLKRE